MQQTLQASLKELPTPTCILKPPHFSRHAHPPLWAGKSARDFRQASGLYPGGVKARPLEFGLPSL